MTRKQLFQYISPLAALTVGLGKRRHGEQRAVHVNYGLYAGAEGAWFRAFDYDNEEFWSSDNDWGLLALCAESRALFCLPVPRASFTHLPRPFSSVRRASLQCVLERQYVYWATMSPGYRASTFALLIASPV